jgi:hypothetical protein
LRENSIYSVHPIDWFRESYNNSGLLDTELLDVTAGYAMSSTEHLEEATSVELGLNDVIRSNAYSAQAEAI